MQCATMQWSLPVLLALRNFGLAGRVLDRFVGFGGHQFDSLRAVDLLVQ